MNEPNVDHLCLGVDGLAGRSGATSSCDLHIGTGTDQQGLKHEHVLKSPPAPSEGVSGPIMSAFRRIETSSTEPAWQMQSSVNPTGVV